MGTAREVSPAGSGEELGGNAAGRGGGCVVRGWGVGRLRWRKRGKGNVQEGDKSEGLKDGWNLSHLHGPIQFPYPDPPDPPTPAPHAAPAIGRGTLLEGGWGNQGPTAPLFRTRPPSPGGN